MQKNTTGLPNTDDYNLGRGRLYFAILDATGLPQAYRDLGNVPEFRSSMNTETLKHQSSRKGLRVTDKEVTVSQDLELTFMFDEFNTANLAALFSGQVASYTNAAIAGFAVHTMVPDANLELGRWYDIKNSVGQRAYDINTADVTVTTNEASPISLALGVDYDLDLTQGRLFVISTSAKVATSITGGKGLRVTLAVKSTARTVTEVRGLVSSAPEGTLKFIAINPANDDEETEFNFWNVSLKADGDLNLIGDDWMKGGFKATCGENSNALYIASPTISIRALNKVA